MAKQAAAEAALSSFVDVPTYRNSKYGNGVPWTTIASFALYKLLKNWQENDYQYSYEPNSSGLSPGWFEF